MCIHKHKNGNWWQMIYLCRKCIDIIYNFIKYECLNYKTFPNDQIHMILHK